MKNLEQEFKFNEIKSVDTQSFETLWTVPKNLSLFNGHFPDQPVLPGVGIIDGNLFLLKTIVPHPFKLAKIVNSKFSHPVTPEMQVQIRISQVKDNEWACEWKSGEMDAQIICQMSLQIALEARK